jgi:hypothetical protein
MRQRIEVEPGQRFNRLTYIREVEPRNNRRRAEFLCDCGNTLETSVHGVRYGQTHSCGCYFKQRMVETFTTHGATSGGRSRGAYNAWRAMLERCKNPNVKSYHNYGGRGIKVCERWSSFENFLADVGERPSTKHSIDRYPDMNGNYEPGNVRWATAKEQMRNMRNNRPITIGDETRLLCEWSEVSGIPVKTIHQRLFKGWNARRAVFEPIHTEKITHAALRARAAGAR